MEREKRTEMRLEMDSLSENEEFARVVVAVFLSRLNPTLEELDDVKTAVSEAVTNAVIHGYGGGPGTIFTTDTAGERSGMGFSFMEAFMDQVEVISAPGQGTRVIMKKRIGA